MASNTDSSSSSSSDVDVANLMKKMAEMKTRALVDAEKDRQLEQEFARLKAARNQRQQRSVLKTSMDATGRDLLEEIKAAPPSSNKDTPQSLEELEEQFQKKQEARAAERERIRTQGTASAGPRLGGTIPLGLGGGLSAVDLPPDFEKVPMKMHRGNMTPKQKDFARQVAAAALGGQPKSQSINVPVKEETNTPRFHEPVHRSSAPATISEFKESDGSHSLPKTEIKSLADNSFSRGESSLSKATEASTQISTLQSKPMAEPPLMQNDKVNTAESTMQMSLQDKPISQPTKPISEPASVQAPSTSPAPSMPKQLPPLRGKQTMDSAPTAEPPKSPEPSTRQMPPLRTKPVIDSANSFPMTTATKIPADIPFNSKPLSPIKKLPLLRSPLETNVDKPTSYMSSYLRAEETKPRPIHGRDASAGTIRATLPWMMASSPKTITPTKAMDSDENSSKAAIPTKATFSTLDNAINNQVGRIAPKAVTKEPELVPLTEDKSTQFHGTLAQSSKAESADDKPKPPKDEHIVVTDTVTSVNTIVEEPIKEALKEPVEEETVKQDTTVLEPTKREPSFKGPQRFGKTIPITPMAGTKTETAMKAPDIKPLKREESAGSMYSAAGRNFHRSDSITSNSSTISSSSARSGMSYASLGSLGSGSFVDSSKRVSTQEKQSVWEKRGGAWVRKAEAKDASPKKDEPVSRVTTSETDRERERQLEPVDFASKLGGIMSRGSPMMGAPRFNKPTEHVTNAPMPSYGMSRGIALPGMAKKAEPTMKTPETEDPTEAAKAGGDYEAKADNEDGPALAHLTKNRARRAPRR